MFVDRYRILNRVGLSFGERLHEERNLARRDGANRPFDALTVVRRHDDVGDARRAVVKDERGRFAGFGEFQSDLDLLLLVGVVVNDRGKNRFVAARQESRLFHADDKVLRGHDARLAGADPQTVADGPRGDLPRREVVGHVDFDVDNAVVVRDEIGDPVREIGEVFTNLRLGEGRFVARLRFRAVFERRGFFFHHRGGRRRGKRFRFRSRLHRRRGVGDGFFGDFHIVEGGARHRGHCHAASHAAHAARHRAHRGVKGAIAILSESSRRLRTGEAARHCDAAKRADRSHAIRRVGVPEAQISDVEVRTTAETRHVIRRSVTPPFPEELADIADVRAARNRLQRLIVDGYDRLTYDRLAVRVGETELKLRLFARLDAFLFRGNRDVEHALLRRNDDFLLFLDHSPVEDGKRVDEEVRLVALFDLNVVVGDAIFKI